MKQYLDTLDYEKLLNILRRDVKDKRIIQWIMRYLKSGVMENGAVKKAKNDRRREGICEALHISAKMRSACLMPNCKQIQHTPGFMTATLLLFQRPELPQG